MKHNLTIEQAQSTDYNLLSAQASSPVPKKIKKTSWLHTILWMLSMVVLVNVLMAVLFYALNYYKIIH